MKSRNRGINRSAKGLWGAMDCPERGFMPRKSLMEWSDQPLTSGMAPRVPSLDYQGGLPAATDYAGWNYGRLRPMLALDLDLCLTPLTNCDQHYLPQVCEGHNLLMGSGTRALFTGGGAGLSLPKRQPLH